MKRYAIGQSSWFERAALTLFSVMAVVIVIARATKHGFEWGSIFVPVMLAYFWYMTLVPVRVVLVSADGEVTFQNVLRKRRTRIADIVEVRPMMNLGSNDFVLKHRSGSELLFGDPTAVAALVGDLYDLGATFPSRGLPERPGAVV